MNRDERRRQRRNEEQKAAVEGRQLPRQRRGPNCPPAVRERVGRELAALAADKGGELADGDYAPYIVQTGRDVRQLQRYKEEAEKLAAQELLLYGSPDEQPDPMAIKRARARLRGERLLPMPNEHDELVLTAAPSEYEAFLLLRADTRSVVCQTGMGKSTFYDMLGRVEPARREGWRRGSDKMRAKQPHLPRRVTRLGQSWSIDVHHLRVWFRIPGSEERCLDVHSVRWEDEATGCVMAKQLFDHTPGDEEIAALYATAVRGWTLEVPGRGELVLQGAPSTITSDNATNLTGPLMRKSEALTGTVQSPVQGGEPEADGRHERGNQYFDPVFSRAPGHARPRTARLSKP